MNVYKIMSIKTEHELVRECVSKREREMQRLYQNDKHSTNAEIQDETLPLKLKRAFGALILFFVSLQIVVAVYAKSSTAAPAQVLSLLCAFYNKRRKLFNDACSNREPKDILRCNFYSKYLNISTFLFIGHIYIQEDTYIKNTCDSFFAIATIF